jgi:hypothetical protein
MEQLQLFYISVDGQFTTGKPTPYFLPPTGMQSFIGGGVFGCF